MLFIILILFFAYFPHILGDSLSFLFFWEKIHWAYLVLTCLLKCEIKYNFKQLIANKLIKLPL